MHAKPLIPSNHSILFVFIIYPLYKANSIYSFAFIILIGLMFLNPIIGTITEKSDTSKTQILSNNIIPASKEINCIFSTMRVVAKLINDATKTSLATPINKYRPSQERMHVNSPTLKI